MASSFLYHGTDIGVVTAARAPTVAHCTQRVIEPLIRLPKSSVVTLAADRGLDASSSRSPTSTRSTSRSRSTPTRSSSPA